MDQDGLFLMLKMCNACSHNKGSWKKCMSRRHNPRMTTVRQEELTYGHRQCVKPDQPITIYKLRDHETNDEFLEFDEEIIFQTACAECLNIKSCLNAGHKLVDWRPTFAGGRVAGSASPFAPSSQTPAYSSPREVSPPPGGGGLRSGGGGGAKKGKGGATPTRSKSSRGKSSSADTVAEDEDEEDEPVWTAPPKASHKRKASSVASNSRTNHGKGGSSRSLASTSSQNNSWAQKAKIGRKRGGARVINSRGRRSSTDENGDVPPKMDMEIDTDSSGVGERPHKRRGKEGNPAAVTPSPKTIHQDSFETSSNGEVEETASNEDSIVDGGVSEPSSPTPVPKTVAEELELVQRQEADLLREFEDTHNKSARREREKREEMAEFQRLGELALISIEEEKEEALRRISAERKVRAAERLKLVQKRMQELEAEEESSRIEAREKDARLEAEKERLINEAAATDDDVATARESNGKKHPDWAYDSWLLSGMTGSEGARVGDKKNALQTGRTPPPKAFSYVRDEKSGAKAAAVAKLLAGAVTSLVGSTVETTPGERRSEGKATTRSASTAVVSDASAGKERGSAEVEESAGANAKTLAGAAAEAASNGGGDLSSPARNSTKAAVSRVGKSGTKEAGRGATTDKRAAGPEGVADAPEKTAVAAEKANDVDDIAAEEDGEEGSAEGRATEECDGGDTVPATDTDLSDKNASVAAR